MKHSSEGGMATLQPRVSKLTVASMLSVISYVIILCLTVAWKTVLLGIFGKLAMLILPALAILAIVLGGQSKKHIKCSEGTLTGSGWASAVEIAGAVLLLFSFQVMISLPAYIAYTRRSYDANVKSKLKNAAKAQMAYYSDNATYAANIDGLTDLNPNDNVTITMEATATTFVISGKVKKGCSPNSGTWSINGSTGAIDGTPCR